MLDNCSLETETIKLIQDDLQYYLECNQEPDFAENELIYEDLQLEDGPNSETTVCTCECVSCLSEIWMYYCVYMYIHACVCMYVIRLITMQILVLSPDCHTSQQIIVM